MRGCDSRPTIDVRELRIEFYISFSISAQGILFFFLCNSLPLTIKGKKREKLMGGCLSKLHFPRGGGELIDLFIYLLLILAGENDPGWVAARSRHHTTLKALLSSTSTAPPAAGWCHDLHACGTERARCRARLHSRH